MPPPPSTWRSARWRNFPSRLIAEGLPRETPAFAMIAIARQDARIIASTIADLPGELAKAESTGPCLVLIGQVLHAADAGAPTPAPMWLTPTAEQTPDRGGIFAFPVQVLKRRIKATPRHQKFATLQLIRGRAPPGAPLLLPRAAGYSCVRGGRGGPVSCRRGTRVCHRRVGSRMRSGCRRPGLRGVRWE